MVRNIWSNTIETYGRHAWPILLFALQDPFIPLLLEAYKIMTGKEAISAHKFFEVRMESRTRGYGYKLYKNELESGRIDLSVRGLLINETIWMRGLLGLQWTRWTNSRDS